LRSQNDVRRLGKTYGGVKLHLPGRGAS
jgi:hypothetical protein